jgi:hypothetical protein
MIVFYRVRRGHDDEDFFDLVEAFTVHSVLDDSFLLRTGRRHDARESSNCSIKFWRLGTIQKPIETRICKGIYI